MPTARDFDSPDIFDEEPADQAPAIAFFMAHGLDKNDALHLTLIAMAMEYTATPKELFKVAADTDVLLASSTIES